MRQQQQRHQQRRRGQEPGVVGSSSRTTSSCSTHSVTLVGMSSVIERTQKEQQQELRRRSSRTNIGGGATEFTKATATTAETALTMSSVEEPFESSRRKNNRGFNNSNKNNNNGCANGSIKSRRGVEPEGVIVVSGSTSHHQDRGRESAASVRDSRASRGSSRSHPRSRQSPLLQQLPSAPRAHSTNRKDKPNKNQERNNKNMDESNGSTDVSASGMIIGMEEKEMDDNNSPQRGDGAPVATPATKRSERRKPRKSGMGRNFTSKSSNVKSASTGYKAPPAKPNKRAPAPRKPAFPGANFDSRGRCIHHPSIQLQERICDKWHIVEKHCPLCPGDGSRGSSDRMRVDGREDGQEGNGDKPLPNSRQNEQSQRTANNVNVEQHPPPTKSKGRGRSFSRPRALSRMKNKTKTNNANDEHGSTKIEKKGSFMKSKMKKLGGRSRTRLGRFSGDRKSKRNNIDEMGTDGRGGTSSANSLNEDDRMKEEGVDNGRENRSGSRSGSPLRAALRPPVGSVTLKISRTGRGSPTHHRSPSNRHSSPQRRGSFDSFDGSSCHSSMSRSLSPSIMPTPRTYAKKNGGNSLCSSRSSESPSFRRNSRAGSSGGGRSISPPPPPPHLRRNSSSPAMARHRRGSPYQRRVSHSQSPPQRSWSSGRPIGGYNNRGRPNSNHRPSSRGRPIGGNNGRGGPAPYNGNRPPHARGRSQSLRRAPPGGPAMRRRSPSDQSRNSRFSSSPPRRRDSRSPTLSRSPLSSRGSLGRSPPPFRGRDQGRNSLSPSLTRGSFSRSPPPFRGRRRRSESRSPRNSLSPASLHGSFSGSPPPFRQRQPRSRRNSMSSRPSRGSFSRSPPSFRGGPRTQRRHSLSPSIRSGSSGSSRSNHSCSPPPRGRSPSNNQMSNRNTSHKQRRPGRGLVVSGRRTPSRFSPSRRSLSPPSHQLDRRHQRYQQQQPHGGRPAYNGRPMGRGRPSRGPVERRSRSPINRRSISRGPGSRNGRPSSRGRPGGRPGNSSQSRDGMRSPPNDDTVDNSFALVVRERTPSPDATMETSVELNPDRNNRRNGGGRDVVNRGPSNRGRASSLPRSESPSPISPRLSMGYNNPRHRRLSNNSLLSARNSLSPPTRSMHTQSTRSPSPPLTQKSSVASMRSAQSQSLPPPEPEIWIQCQHTEDDPFDNSFTTFDEWSLPPQFAATARAGGTHVGHHFPGSLPPVPAREGMDRRRDNSLERSPNSFDRSLSPHRRRRERSLDRLQNSLDGSPPSPSMRRQNSFDNISQPPRENSFNRAPSPPLQTLSDHNQLKSSNIAMATTRSKASHLSMISHQIANSNNSAPSRSQRKQRQGDDRNQKNRKSKGVKDMKAVDMTNVEMALRVIQERSKKSLRVDSTPPPETVGTAAGKNSSKSPSIHFSIMTPGPAPQRPLATTGASKFMPTTAATTTLKSSPSSVNQKPEPSRPRSPLLRSSGPDIGSSTHNRRRRKSPAAQRNHYDSSFKGSGLAPSSVSARGSNMSATGSALNIDAGPVVRHTPRETAQSPPPPPQSMLQQQHQPPPNEVNRPQHQEYELPMKNEPKAGEADSWRRYQVKSDRQRSPSINRQQQHQEELQRQHQDEERRLQEELNRQQQQQKVSQQGAAFQQEGGGADQSWLNYMVGDNDDHDDQLQRVRSGSAGRNDSSRRGYAEQKAKMFGREPKNRPKSDRENLKGVKQMPFRDKFGDHGTYTGQVNEEGRPEGKGAMKYENGVFYEGTWTDGCQDEKAASQYGRIRGGFTSWSGKGKSATKSGMVMPWNARKNDAHDTSNSKTNVRGMEWTDLNGDTGRYTGEVNSDQLPQGRGIMKYNYGLIAEGDWVNGVLKEGPQDRMISAATSSGMSVGPMSVGGLGGMSVGPMSVSGLGGMSVGPMSVGGQGGMSVGPMSVGGLGGMSVGPMSVGPMSVRSMSVGPMGVGQMQLMPQRVNMGQPMSMPMPMMQHPPPMQYNPTMPMMNNGPSHAAQHAHIAQQNAMMRNVYGGGGGPMMPPQPMQMQVPMYPSMQQRQQLPHPQMPSIPQTSSNKPPISEIKIGK